jgi:acetyltransferase-like isoleucine patch superfamily enzyme
VGRGGCFTKPNKFFNFFFALLYVSPFSHKPNYPSAHLLSANSMSDFAKRLRGLFKKGGARLLQERYPQYRIGRHSYGDLKVRQWGEGAKLEIGSFCSIAGGVKIFLGGEHRADWVTTFPFTDLWREDAGYLPGHPHSKGDVIIGNDVWIGAEALIMSGVKVGDGAVIGARAVVTKNVPPYAIVAGNPARLVRFRFDQNVIDRLIRLAWWDCNDEQIKKLLPLMLSQDIEVFLAAAEKVSVHTA